MTEATSAADVTPSPFAGGDWFDPLEEAVRLQVRGFIEELLRRSWRQPSAAAATNVAAPGRGTAMAVEPASW